LTTGGLLCGRTCQALLDSGVFCSLSTTVVLLGLHAFCRASLGRCLEASGATSTRPASVPLAAAWPAQDARRADESRCPSAARQPSRRLACRQAARVGGPQGFWGLLRWQGGGPQDRQPRLRPHGQGERAIPSRPPAPCLLIQPALALGRFTAALHGPPAPGHPHHCLQRARVGSKHDGGRQGRGRTHTPPAHQPAAPDWEPRRRQGPPAPRLPAESLGPRAGPASGPAVRRQGRPPRVPVALRPALLALCLPRARQDVGALLCLPPPPPPPLSALAPLPRHPGRGHLRVARAREQLACQRRRRRRRRRRGDSSALTARASLRPVCGQREGPVPQGRALTTGLGQHHPTLAGRPPPCRPTLLPRHARRMLTFVATPGLSKAQDRLRLA
jgi:hypothetical protein